ncbi:lipopolysaccharide assembly protein LapB [Lysinibacillus fusiformis]|uniref:tetratricopeptide repeat protein n=1 Tax=Lysinibacillus fusiformis TaxID=28031 RepID=UPI0011A8079F|nr:hypothetical protein [Lysinibacillus fusiformis]
MFEKIRSFFKPKELDAKLEVSINTNDVMSSTLTQNIIVVENSTHNLQDILNTINNGDFHDNNSLLNSLLKNNLATMSKYLSDRNFPQVQSELNSIINHANFNKIKDDIKSEYMYMQGLVYIEAGQVENAEDIISNLLSYGKKHTLLELEMKLLAIKKDKSLINEYIEKLQKLNLGVEEIILRKGYLKIVTEDYEEALELLYPENTIINNLENKQEYHYYVGIVFFNIGNMELAEKFLTKSNTLHKTIYKEFLLTLCKIQPVFENENLTLKNSTQNKEILEPSLKNLSSYEKYFINERKDIKEQFYGALFNLLLYINPQEVLNKINCDICPSISTDILILYKGEANFFLGKFETALNEYRKLVYSQNELLVERVYICLYELNYYHELIDEFELNYLAKNPNPNDENFILELYIRACNEYYEYEKFEEIINHLESRGLENSWIFNVVLLQLKKETKYLQNLLAFSTNLDAKAAYVVSKDLVKLKYYEEALLIIEKFKLVSEEYLIFYIEIALYDTKIDSKQPFIELLLETTINLDENVKNYLLANLNFSENDFLATIEYYEKIAINDMELYDNEKIAYEVLASKLNINDSTNTEMYIEILKNSGNPHYLMITALALRDLSKDFHKGLSLAYRSVLILKEKFDPIIYWNYISFFMPYIRLYSQESLINTEIKNVTFDCIVYLRDTINNNLLNICIHNNLAGLSEYISDSETKHVEVGSIEDVLLRKKSVNDIVQIDGVDYRITNINNKYYDKYINCWQRYNEEDFPEKQLKAIEFDENDIQTSLENIKALLPKSDFQKELILSYYKGEIPLIILSQGKYNKMHALINWLMISHKDQLLAGVSRKVIDKEKVVFSLSSILFLELIGALSDIQKLNIDIFVTKSTIVFVDKMFQEALNNENSKATMFLDEANNLRFVEISDEEKLQEINFWRNILTFVQQVENKSVFNRIIPLLKSNDIDLEIDSLNLAYDLRATYISEDNFFKHLIKPYETLKVTNSIALIDMLLEKGLIDFNFYMKKIRMLDESKYSSYKSTNQLLIVIEHLLKLPQRLLFQVSPELIEFENLLYRYLIRGRAWLVNLYLVQRILCDLYGRGNFKNVLPIIKSIFNSLSKASVTLHGTPNILPSLTMHYLNRLLNNNKIVDNYL